MLDSKFNLGIIIPIGSALFVVFLLFFIDEGYYNFNWMKEPMNWFAFFLYFGLILLGEALTAIALIKVKESVKKALAISVIGVLLGVSTAFYVLG